MDDDTTTLRRDIALLLWRAGFGATPAEIARGLQRGYAGTVERLLAFPDAAARPARPPRDVRAWWVARMRAATPDGASGIWPLQEKLTLFWHGHFTSSIDELDGDTGVPLMLAQNELFRGVGAGRFVDLLGAVARDPAMLIYLSNDENVAEAPNENWGRELLELFTLGLGNYTEADVKACARAFTGWGLADDGLRFAFHPDDHDAGLKTFLGVTGRLDGADIIRLLATPGGPGFPAVARHLTGRLFRFFVHARPSDADLAPLVDAFTRSGGDIRETLRALFHSAAFRGEASRSEHVRTPVDYTVGAVRALELDFPSDQLVDALDAQGQRLLAPPNVGGWPGGLAWLGTESQVARFALAGDVAQAAVAKLFLASPTGATWAELLDMLASRLALALCPETRAKILALLGVPAPAGTDDRTALLVQLLLIAPEMQVA